ncbi:MAG: YegS/Rv2252/BmrU family lipid kinase [Clostridia bacterium]|nr:YegS/Rv2252/BmrU family lipid kinase [Clostridia bacterium]
MRALVLINPNAGNGELIKNTPFIIKKLNEGGIETDVMLTSGRGDATNYVKTYGKGRKLIICAGGDGTLNEVINGVMSFKKEQRPNIGYIPCGTTNDFARSLRIPIEIPEAVKCITEGTPVPYDIGKFNDRYFVYVAACGAFSGSSYTTPQDMKKIFGHIAYIFEGIKEIPAIKPHHMRFEFDTGEILEGNYAFGAISNTRSYGGLINLEKLGVDISDGLFEMTLVKLPKNLIETGKVAISLSSGEYDKNLITFERFSSCRIFVDSDSLNWSVDGEKGASSDIIEIENIHSAVNFIIKERKFDIPTDILD